VKNAGYRLVVATVLAALTLVLMGAGSVEEARLRALVDLAGFIRERNVGTFEYKKFVEGAISGMLRTLDPHSTFMNEENYRRMQEDQQGRFFGIGMIISRRNGKITVVAPLANTPAARIGLRAGDIIYEIEGESTEDMTVNQAVALLRGEKGTKVSIAIKRPGVKDLLHFTVTRAEIPERSVEYAFMVDEQTGYVLLKNFGERTAADMDEALQQLSDQGMKRLVLDLRNNPGGLLSAAVYVADLFLPEGSSIVSIRGRSPRDQQTFTATRSTPWETLPLVVLINRGSASGSEIVAGSVQDNDRGLVVGQTSWGKGLVQSVFMVDREEALALTTAKYYTASGRCIQRDYSKSFADYFNPRAHAKEKKEETSQESAYRTLTGRPVAGGGGITPDIQVEMGKLDDFLIDLRFRTSAFFRFALAYNQSHQDVTRDFEADGTVLAAFKAFLKQEGIAYTDEQIQAHKVYIRTTIEQEILSNRFGLAEGARRFLRIDDQFQAAVGAFDRAAALYRKAQLVRKKQASMPEKGDPV